MSTWQFFIEGNIGVGKSTFLKLIQNSFDCQMIFEPHQKWQDVQGQGNLLHHFYHDTSRWAYSFQTYAFITRIMEQNQRAAQYPEQSQIIERSVFSDRYCFAKLATQLGNMNAMEWDIYQQWFDWLMAAHMDPPTAFIYLQTRPETCYQRLQKRARSEEAGVSLDYLTALHLKHEDWLVHKKDIDPKLLEIPVLILDCNPDFEQHPARQQELIRQIQESFGSRLCGIRTMS